jgi:hypothetical protein
MKKKNIQKSQFVLFIEVTTIIIITLCALLFVYR